MGIFEESRCIALQVQGIQFGHLDRTRRYNQVISILHSSNASLSFPELFKNQHQLKGFYRLMNNKSVNHSTFILGYQSGLIAYSKEQNNADPWILVQDTMLTDYNSRTLDLGYTQNERSNGFLLHHGLLLDEQFAPLGLLHQEVIHRERDDFGKAAKWRSKSIAEKESNKWLEGVKTGISFSKETGRDLIHIMDREADIVEVINKCIGANQYFIIRARHDRSTLTLSEKDKAEAPELYRLFQLMPSLPDPFTIVRPLRNAKGKEYEAKCDMSCHSFKFRGIDKEINCVWIREQISTEEEKPAEWFLLTNRVIKNEKDAEKIAEFYSKRWTVEDFHKCYKTGCSIEKRQFDTRKALTTSIGLLAITAIVLLRSRYYAKHQHSIPFEIMVTDKAEQELAKRIADKYLMPTDKLLCEPYTALWWLLLLGRMGGHQGLKNKGLPGWQTLWKGYSFFQSLVIGFNYANNSS
ncbi:IS4 family transposase [Mucilaginibacter angelicae]|uniref:IS4 family transposase n=1 Tax=Mucilaginibacter angelicae TaxID=869718 RepID=A0ABV6LA46_9SPHI